MNSLRLPWLFDEPRSVVLAPSVIRILQALPLLIFCLVTIRSPFQRTKKDDRVPGCYWHAIFSLEFQEGIGMLVNEVAEPDK